MPPGKLQAEIRQSKPFGSIEQEAFLNLARTTDQIEQAIDHVLKPFGISHTQYNVLRILRGAGKAGIPCGEIAARMVSHDPDITRLLDRMEKRGLVTRSRQTKDRRVVLVCTTAEGLKLIKAVDRPLNAALQAQLGHAGKAALNNLVELLELIRGVDSYAEALTIRQPLNHSPL